MYVNINYLELIKFNNCRDCIECCKNKLMAPLVLDDFEKVYKFFPILIAKLDYLKPVMLLSNGTSCPYLKNELCSIYESRPPACKIYPYSPWYDRILLDLSCKGIGIDGEILPTNPDDFKNSNFYEERFENIDKKLEETLTWTSNLKLNYITKIKNIELYIINNNFKDKYIFFHKASLNHLKKYNINF
ncbi:YkgJ family cysteine cluster protein [Nautilia lithotrophica]